jgi:hypothetical protein
MKISKNLSDELSLKFGFDSALFLGEKNWNFLWEFLVFKMKISNLINYLVDMWSGVKLPLYSRWPK